MYSHPRSTPESHTLRNTSSREDSAPHVHAPCQARTQWRLPSSHIHPLFVDLTSMGKRDQ